MRGKRFLRGAKPLLNAPKVRELKRGFASLN
jgi:hypothetical protein